LLGVLVPFGCVPVVGVDLVGLLAQAWIDREPAGAGAAFRLAGSLALDNSGLRENPCFRKC
jgi:hypothetical protein